VPVGAGVVVLVVVVVGALVVVVVGAVTVALVVIGGEVNVGPADAGKPTVVLTPVRCRFGEGGAAGWRLTVLALRAGAAAEAGCELEFAWTGAAATWRCPGWWR
jgi:hypothetical protein